MGKVFIFDAAKCNGCRNCQLACKDEHVDNEWLPYAKPQPDTGQFWTSMEEIIRGQVPKVKVSYVMHRCQHCDNAPCMKAAPDAVYKREDGLVIIDPVKAEGKRELVDACPYGAIYWNKELGLAQKCTGCYDRRQQGLDPACVAACINRSLQWGKTDGRCDETTLHRWLPAVLPEPGKTGPRTKINCAILPREEQDDDSL